MQMPFSFWKFSPLSLPNLAWWLDAGRGITIATGVSQWNDLSGNNRNATQPTAGSQPALTTNAIGGFPAVTFDGASSYMLSGMTVATFFAGNLTDTTIIAVMNSTVVVGGGCMLGSNGPPILTGSGFTRPTRTAEPPSGTLARSAPAG